MATDKICTIQLLLLVVIVLTNIVSFDANAQRLKDMVSVSGVRDNQLIGYGLVVGLNGTGDQTTQTPFTIQTFNNMLKKFGITPTPGVTPQLKNVAAVAIHAELPAFAKPGQKLDITINSIGNSKSLRGGSLLVTPLKGVDGRIYALAQGNLVVGGFGVDGADGSSITVNVPSVGRIPNGAIIERAAPSGFMQGDIIFNLHQPDFTTVKRITDTINGLLGPDVAYALDGGSIRVSAPISANERVNYLGVLENLEVEAGEAAAKVIINSRTGTIIIGQHVEVSPAAITHGSLTVTISENPEASQPGTLANGETVVVPQTDIDVTQEKNRMFHFKPGVSLEDIVSAVNQVGAAPGDLMAILEGLKQAGALKAELVVI
ncbi:MAG: flagellar basal body P-ring protein FlgI [Pseudomonadales bacterium]|nr:flagellar basal body P-ring protein FlgI [Pseudomonadales bacterium]